MRNANTIAAMVMAVAVAAAVAAGGGRGDIKDCHRWRRRRMRRRAVKGAKVTALMTTEGAGDAALAANCRMS
jgi:hypothetical protein